MAKPIAKMNKPIIPPSIGNGGGGGGGPWANILPAIRTKTINKNLLKY